MEATLAKMIVLKHMDSEVANYYSQWRDNDSKPPRKPSTKNVFYLQGMQGQIQSRDSRPDQPMTDIIWDPTHGQESFLETITESLLFL